MACVGEHQAAERGHWKQCPVCGRDFRARKSIRRTCSRSCGGKFSAREAQQRGTKATAQKSLPARQIRTLVYFLTCQRCGRIYCARAPHAKYCSVECRLGVAADRVTGLYSLACTKDMGGGSWRQLLVEYLIRRDGRRCAICKRKIDFTIKSGTKGSRNGYSIDHVVPRSKGGTDDLANLRLAHWGCNQTRGNRGGGEQLALVG